MQQNVDVWIEENLVMMFVTVWTLVLCLRRKPGGSRRIPGADLGDRNIPALKAATVEDRAFTTCEASHPSGAGRRASRPVKR
jgi:hypothetical protein